MTQENTQHRYSITDILGAPCSEEEARRRIREETDLTTLNVFHSMQTAAQERLLEFIMGKMCIRDRAYPVSHPHSSSG